MKKLMIAAAIVCAAAMSQAATVNWGGTTEWSEGTYDGGYAYEGATYSFFLLNSYAGEEIGYTKDGNLVIGESTYTAVDTHALTADEADNGEFTVRKDFAADDLNGKVAVLAVYDPDSAADKFAAAVYNISGLSDGGQAGVLNTGMSSANFATDTPLMSAVAGDIQAVPEPTSGLLLLLGVAGLALRRRRA